MSSPLFYFSPDFLPNLLFYSGRSRPVNAPQSVRWLESALALGQTGAAKCIPDLAEREDKSKAGHKTSSQLNPLFPRAQGLPATLIARSQLNISITTEISQAEEMLAWLLACRVISRNM